jgi:hypothetical protein
VTHPVEKLCATKERSRSRPVIAGGIEPTESDGLSRSGLGRGAMKHASK